jgi:hypothetical protein
MPRPALGSHREGGYFGVRRSTSLEQLAVALAQSVRLVWLESAQRTDGRELLAGDLTSTCERTPAGDERARAEQLAVGAQELGDPVVLERTRMELQGA